MTPSNPQASPAPFRSPPAADADEAPPPRARQSWALTVDLDGHPLDDDNPEAGLAITQGGAPAE